MPQRKPEKHMTPDELQIKNAISELGRIADKTEKEMQGRRADHEKIVGEQVKRKAG